MGLENRARITTRTTNSAAMASAKPVLLWTDRWPRTLESGRDAAFLPSLRPQLSCPDRLRLLGHRSKGKGARPSRAGVGGERIACFFGKPTTDASGAERPTNRRGRTGGRHRPSRPGLHQRPSVGCTSMDHAPGRGPRVRAGIVDLCTGENRRDATGSGWVRKQSGETLKPPATKTHPSLSWVGSVDREIEQQADHSRFGLAFLGGLLMRTIGQPGVSGLRQSGSRPNKQYPQHPPASR